jgi:hypothetical protein
MLSNAADKMINGINPLNSPLQIPYHNEQTSSSSSSSSSSITTFGSTQFTNEENERINYLLDRKLSKDEIATRPGPRGGKQDYYIEIFIIVNIFTQIVSKNKTIINK